MTIVLQHGSHSYVRSNEVSTIEYFELGKLLSMGTLIYFRSSCDTGGCFWCSRYLFSSSSFSSNVIRWAKTAMYWHFNLAGSHQFQNKLFIESC